ncbi:hypothetical protein [Desulfovibrio sp. TomC]|uniref:hypothetical protein n=1 Tax=Desulfovibrio sp. TomC TaxID=1562888 RepID=UPI000574C784|nr:hypothetical protein [Desulfovibrio sp. TomC]KHK04068.1 secreted protein [Desulfovibrio sp. TomC]
MAHVLWLLVGVLAVVVLDLGAGLSGQTAVALALGQGGYHRAATEAEKTLDRVLRLSEKDPDLVAFLLATPQYKARAGKDYGRYVTPRLRTDLAALERATVAENCQGKYLDGELCGLDYNPLTCAQDLADGAYLYQTASSGDGRAEISYKWPGEKDSLGRFTLVQDGGVWKIDAVTCLP